MARSETVVGHTRRIFKEEFDAMGVKEIGKDGGRAFRKSVLAKVAKAIETSPASRSSAYNTVRKENIEDKTIKSDLIGRGAPKEITKAAPSTD